MTTTPRRIRYNALDPAERDRIIRAGLEAEQNERIAILRGKDNSEFVKPKGRPCKEPPPPEVSRMILDDIEDGLDQRAIERKYQPYFPFSRRTLARWLSDGTLQRVISQATAVGE